MATHAESINTDLQLGVDKRLRRTQHEGGVTRVSEWIRISPPPVMGLQSLVVGFSFKIKKSPRRWGMLSSSYFFHGNKIKHMFSEGSLQSFTPERVTINIGGGGGGS